MDSLTENSKTVTSGFLLAQKIAYEPAGLFVENLLFERESKEYGAAEFEINHSRVKYRTGKITPTKTGQFVTFWKRPGNGPIMPYDLTDPFDLLVVSVRSDNRTGQFVFPKSVLAEKGIVSKDLKGGKRAMRIYPSWDQAENAQAKKSQLWQLRYFFEFSEDLKVDLAQVQSLFSPSYIVKQLGN